MKILELLFGAFTLLVGMGLTLGGPAFAKLGIPLTLPQTLGGIPHQPPKLFIFEIYLILVMLMARPRISRLPSLKGQPMLYLAVAILLYGVARTIPDLAANPLQAIRNASFVWYLALPLIICAVPVRAAFMEGLMGAFAAFIFLHTAIGIFSLIHHPVSASVQWYVAAGGCLGAWALALLHWSPLIYLPTLSIFAAGLAYDFLGRPSRTNLLGLILTFLAVALYSVAKRRAWFLVKRVGVFCLLLMTAFALLPSPVLRRQYIDRAPPVKLTSDSYRESMWRDAWELFKSAPLIGLGFQAPVVHRIYVNDEHFDKNVGDSKLGQAPVAGPHNSYLNAIARMGLSGFGVLVLHLLATYILWTHAYYASLSLLVGQMIYAFFNVGLESPARSFFLLLAIGIALKLEGSEGGEVK